MQSDIKTVNGRDVHHVAQVLEVEKLTWRPGVYGLVLNDAGQILVVENTLNKRYEFPGGGVEIHETFEEALIREVWEETGLNVAMDEFILMQEEFFLVPNGEQWHTVLCFYRCHLIDGEMRNTILEYEPLENPQWMEIDSLTEDTLTMGWEALQRLTALKGSA